MLKPRMTRMIRIRHGAHEFRTTDYTDGTDDKIRHGAHEFRTTDYTDGTDDRNDA